MCIRDRIQTKNMEILNELISTYKDYPKEGIDFKDVLEITQHPIVFKELILKMASSKIVTNAEALISIDARGFIFGSAISFQVSKPMIFARKPGKLLGELIKKKYTLEYGESSLSIQKKSLNNFGSFAIIDDLLATGGTVNCVSNILKDSGKKISRLLTVVNLIDLEGITKFEFPV